MEVFEVETQGYTLLMTIDKLAILARFLSGGQRGHLHPLPLGICLPPLGIRNLIRINRNYLVAPLIFWLVDFAPP